MRGGGFGGDEADGVEDDVAVRVFGEERDGGRGGEIERADGDEERVAALMLIDGDIAGAGGCEDGETDLLGAVFVRGAGDLDFP